MSTPVGARKRMRKMFPERVDIVDRPATRRNLLLMKSAGGTEQLEKQLDGLLTTAASVEALDNLADRLESTGASADLVGELRKVADDLAGAEEEEEEKGKKEPAQKSAKPARRSMVKWFVDRLVSEDLEKKEEPVTEQKKEETPPADKPSETPAAQTRDDLMKSVNEAITKNNEELLKMIGERVGDEIKKATDPIVADVTAIKEAKGMRKSVQGQETQTPPAEPKKPLRKEFGKGMFDDVIHPQLVRVINDKLTAVANGAVGEEEE